MDKHFFKDPSHQRPEHELVLSLEVGSVLMVWVITKPVYIIDLEADHKSDLSKCLKPIEPNELAHFLLEGFLITSAAI